MLADHPDAFARPRNEVLETLSPNRKVSPENLKEMKYPRAVLNGESFFRRGCTIPLTSVLRFTKLYSRTQLPVYIFEVGRYERFQGKRDVRGSGRGNGTVGLGNIRRNHFDRGDGLGVG